MAITEKESYRWIAALQETVEGSPLLRANLWVLASAYPEYIATWPQKGARPRWVQCGLGRRTGTMHPQCIPKLVPRGAEVVGATINRFQEHEEISPL